MNWHTRGRRSSFKKTAGDQYGGSEAIGIQAPSEVKYGLIREAVRQDNNQLCIGTLCRIAGVSRSGYYAWIDAAPLRQSREELDNADFALVKQVYEFRGYRKGARSIYMRLLHLEPPVVMNIKKIRRLMRKYGLYCPIRQVNPYRRMVREMQKSHAAGNKFNRQFRSYAPLKALLTDILGFTFWKSTEGRKSKPAKDRMAKLYKKVKEILCRSRAASIPLGITFVKLNQVMRGWINYFRPGSMKTWLKNDFSPWMRHKVRVVILKQWKKPRTV